jgi:hypothetical protein
MWVSATEGAYQSCGQHSTASGTGQSLLGPRICIFKLSLRDTDVDVTKYSEKRGLNGHTTSTIWVETRRVLKVVQRFGKHFSCHRQGEYVLVGHLEGLIYGLLSHSTNENLHIQCTTFCPPFIRLPEMPNHYIFVMTMATTMIAVTLDSFQHSTQFIHSGWSGTLNSSHKT